MKEFFEVAAVIMFFCAMFILAVGIVSLPFAFVGFIILAAVNVFNAGIIITYLGTVVVGLVAVILIGLISN